MRRLLIAVGSSIMLMLAITMPAAAHVGHRSCAEFGAVTAGYEPGALGALVSSYAPTGPGVIAGIVEWEHGEFCTEP
jgi:hypothetical protein